MAITKSADFTELRLSVDDGVGLIELARPDRGNAWGGRTAVEYRWALHLADTDERVRVIVVTGEGRDFCVGAHTGEIDAISSRGGGYAPEAAELPPFPDDFPERLRRNHAYPWSLSAPVIAAINGACVGAGFVVATYADLRFAADDARIVTAFAGLGLPAEYGTGWVLPRLIGPANALQLLFRPGVVPAAEAERLGWIQRVIPADRLVEETLAYAREIAHSCAPDSLRWMKKAVMVDAVGDFDDAYSRSVADMNEALAGPDLQAAVAARRDKRRHDFLA